MILSDKAYEEIRRRIIRCEMPPGMSFTEGALSQELGVGKTPVREALARLQHERLVTAVPRSGYRVAKITVRDIRELFDLRLVLEADAARKAAQRAGSDPEGVEALRELGRYEFETSRPEQLEELLDANRRFHVAIAELAGNRRLAAYILDVNEQLDRLFHLGFARAIADPPGPTLRHRELVDAIADGRAEDAAALAISHCVASRELMLDAVLSSDAIAEMNLVPQES